jgi:hypothetical protein
MVTQWIVQIAYIGKNIFYVFWVKKHIQYLSDILCAVCQHSIISSTEHTDKELKSSKFVTKQYIAALKSVLVTGTINRLYVRNAALPS